MPRSRVTRRTPKTRRLAVEFKALYRLRRILRVQGLRR